MGETGTAANNEGLGQAAQNSWIRAEDAAATPEEKSAVHQKREKANQERFDAMERQKRAAANAAEAEDKRLQSAQEERIHAAEAKAAEANAPAEEQAENGEVLGWWQANEQSIEGALVRVACEGEEKRLVLAGNGKREVSLSVTGKTKFDGGLSADSFPCGKTAGTTRLQVTTEKAQTKGGRAGTGRAASLEAVRVRALQP